MCSLLSSSDLPFIIYLSRPHTASDEAGYTSGASYELIFMSLDSPSGKSQLLFGAAVAIWAVVPVMEKL